MDSLLQSMARAKSFLVSQISDDHWSEFNSSTFGTSTDWATGFVGYFLGDTFRDDRHARISQWLLKRQRNGLWGWGYNVLPFPSDADSTAMCALFLNAHGYLSIAHKQQIIEGLFRHQQDNGGFATFQNADVFAPVNPAPADISFSGWCMAHGSVTASVLQCLVALGVSPHDSRLASAFDYLEAQQTGLWEDYWWRDPFYATYQAVTALKLREPRAVYPDVTRAIIAQQHPAGYWECDGVESGFSSGMAIKALLQAGHAGKNVWLGIRRLLDTQLADGSWANAAILQIPAPTDTRADRDQISKIHADDNRVFTTVAIYSALLEAMQQAEVRPDATASRQHYFPFPAADVYKPRLRLRSERT